MIAEKIKHIRTQKGFSQEELAEKTNLSLRTIQRVENRKSVPRGNTIIRIADALNVTVDTFIDSKKEENNIYLASLHISALSFLLFPLLGIILPLLLWISKKDQIKSLTSHAKKLLSFQQAEKWLTEQQWYSHRSITPYIKQFWMEVFDKKRPEILPYRVIPNEMEVLAQLAKRSGLALCFDNNAKPFIEDGTLIPSKVTSTTAREVVLLANRKKTKKELTKKVLSLLTK